MPSRPQDRAQPPTGFNCNLSSTSVHEQLGVKSDAEQFEVFSQCSEPPEENEGFFERIKDHLVGTSPCVKAGLAPRKLCYSVNLFHVLVEGGPAVKVISKHCLRKAKLPDRESRIGIEQVPEGGGAREPSPEKLNSPRLPQQNARPTRSPWRRDPQATKRGKQRDVQAARWHEAC